MRPVLQALVVADRVYVDHATGKKIIAGTFSHFFFIKSGASPEIHLPNGTKKRALLGGMQAGSPYGYISLTDVCKGTKLLLQFVNLTTNEVLFGTELSIDSDDRLQTIEVVAPLPSLPITEPGTYALELVWEGEILGFWRITAAELSLK